MFKAVLDNLPPPEHFVFYAMLGAAAILAVQAGLGLFGEVRDSQAMNRRLKIREKAMSVEHLIVELRKQRGLDKEGNFVLPSVWLNRIATRSGLKFEPHIWAALSAGAALAAGAGIGLATKNWLIALGVTAGVFIAAPVLVLSSLGQARAKKLATQLPDALDVVVRSLEAGHPVSVAVGLVGRELPDPIGSEFGMASDEIAYGSSLGQAVQRMAARCGDEDVDLFAATVRLQQTTGGNLTELLKVNAHTIRERQKLRLKVRAASSEGRASAMILTAAPIVVFTAIWFLRPEFYGSVIHMKVTQYVLGGFGLWMVIGNVIMNRMINFKI